MNGTTIPPPPGDATLEESPALLRARALVLRYGWNATAYQILNPGITLWFSAAGDAVVGFVTQRGVRIVAGAPICAAERLEMVAADFEREAHQANEGVCYFGAGARLESVYARGESRGALLLGAQPVWNPALWPEIVERRASLRAQLNRARNKGVCVAEWPVSRATRDSALERCLREWLARRGLPALHFLVEPHTLARLTDRRVFVATRGAEPVAFLVASPVPERRGWLVEQIVRGFLTPNGTSELLVDSAMRALATGGSRYVTLGLAPLSDRAGPVRGAAWVRLLLAWARAHGRRFYNFRGLESFKAKLAPEHWEPIYAISDGPRVGARSLNAIAAAFTGGSPALALARALVRAARQEALWGTARLTGSLHPGREWRARARE